MNLVSKAGIVASLALTTGLVALPSNASPHPYRHANRLDQRAQRAALNGHYGKSIRLRHQATRIRRRTYLRRHY